MWRGVSASFTSALRMALEPEWILGLSLFSLLFIGLATQLARQGAMQRLFLLAIVVISVAVMIAWQQFLSSRMQWSEAKREW